jgi:hypothetical protein
MVTVASLRDIEHPFSAEMDGVLHLKVVSRFIGTTRCLSITKTGQDKCMDMPRGCFPPMPTSPNT